MELKLLRKDAQKILKASLKATNSYEAAKGYLTHYSIPQIKGNLFLIGVGKASCWMAKAVEELFGNKITVGIVVTKYDHRFPLKKVRVIEAGHPIPDINGMKAAKEVSILLAETREEDLILVLISGGGSALLPLPSDGISLADKKKVTSLLLRAGADIYELNTVRKHISKIKGGGLARMAYPARVISLIVSDVIGDDISVISSGLTSPDTSTYSHAFAIIKKFRLESKIPYTILRHIRMGMEGNIEETPKPKDKIFRRVSNVIIANNRLVLNSAKKEAINLGYHAKILTSFLAGEAREVGKFCAALAKKIVEYKDIHRLPTAIILGGETTVIVKGNGRGGRNQELALSAGIGISGIKGVVILSAGTDGSDGPTKVAGAIIDGLTIKRGRKLGLDAKGYLIRNDSYNYFKKVGGHVYTGPTGTNVIDLILILVRQE